MHNIPSKVSRKKKELNFSLRKLQVSSSNLWVYLSIADVFRRQSYVLGVSGLFPMNVSTLEIIVQKMSNASDVRDHSCPAHSSDPCYVP